MTKTGVSNLFDSIAHRYDLLNHVLSLSIDRLWRRRLLRMAAPRPDDKILDICTGTGDIAAAFLRAVPGIGVCGVDFSQKMLEGGRRKVSRVRPGTEKALFPGDAQALPFIDDAFDIATMGFGLRNLSDKKEGIIEAARVLKPGGRLFILEFAPPRSSLLLVPYRLYLGRILPVIGGIVSANRGAYDYLADSIHGFLRPEEVTALMEESGFTDVTSHSMTGGMVYLYQGIKKKRLSS
ncbi:MAG: bifunctional demethylmenaquinone methyltransferase/2-methoxy-6-polyprenyl-1,4-benzoquinol methylase UbiE [Deltaproteobacteria bacterium]|nr:bifunctional demethylmenaquinone methyltransferase/2-methoxy-6-polyprenyl-1,4-benzoquinol methylase UbiE [Candidatus Zymogenaceae bacterium]